MGNNFPKDLKIKEIPKKVLNEKVINIQQNEEYDETKGLDLYHLDEFIDSIIDERFPREKAKNIKKNMNEIKNKQVGEVSSFHEINNIDKDNLFFFICCIKKQTENKINIVYKIRIFNVTYESIPNENENNDNQAILDISINSEYQKLKEKLN